MLVKEFYEFMVKREQIRVARKYGLPRDQWTQDPVLKNFKFTNVKRSDDWTTSKLVTDFYQTAKSTSYSVLLANCAMARFIGLAETVIEIGFQFGFISDEFAENVRSVVDRRSQEKEPIFTGAYMVPNCGLAIPKHEIVIRVVQEVYDWAQIHIDELMPDASFQEVCKGLCSINGFGSFMAKEVLLDFKLMSDWQPSDWETWTPVGPGARRGASRVLHDGAIEPLLGEKAAFEVVRSVYGQRDEFWPKNITIGMVRADAPVLELCDIQFQFCEFDKYLRATRDGGRPKTIFRPRKN